LGQFSHAQPWAACGSITSIMMNVSLGPVDPNWVQKVVRSVQKYVGAFTTRGLQPIVLCSPGSRIHFRKILEKFFPNIIVLSHNEITHDVSIKSLGIVE